MPSLTLYLGTGAQVRRAQLAELVDVCRESADRLVAALYGDIDRCCLVLTDVRQDLTVALERTCGAEDDGVRHLVKAAICCLRRGTLTQDYPPVAAAADLLARVEHIARVEERPLHV